MTSCHICNTNPAFIDAEGDAHACPSCTERKQREKQQIALERGYGMWIIHSGVPPLYHIARHTRPDESLIGKSVYLYGPTGRGKTHMMIATMIHEYFMGEKDSLFITMTDLLEQIRRTYNNPTIEDPVAQFMSVKHLYIDDIGVEKVTEWVVQTVDRLINHRYNWMLRTTISSNFTPQELAERFEARIASRIVGMCSLVAVEGRDRRLVK